MQPAIEGDYEPAEENFPKVPITATVSADGQRITFILPQEFIKASVTVAGDNNGRHRIILDPIYGGQEVIGFVDPQGVKHGKFEFNPAVLGITNLVPHKTNTWWSRQRDRDILMSRLLSGLTAAPPPPKIEKVKQIAPPAPTPAPTTLAFTNIETAINFVNEWAEKNSAQLGVEQNAVFAEVRRRIGGK